MSPGGISRVQGIYGDYEVAPLIHNKLGMLSNDIELYTPLRMR